ncbi:MAG: M1 family metallopeptidase [Candidatus Latescibacteria bacterium]|nr:M1 family metallopeptidase [Candidatus Latescibacterota bacterium]
MPRTFVVIRWSVVVSLLGLLLLAGSDAPSLSSLRAAQQAAETQPDTVMVELPPPMSPSSSAEADWMQRLVLPRQSPRIANYTMEVTLDPKTNVISGWEELTWTNTSGQSLQEFPFHLYHNAWKNNRSTFAKEGGGDLGREKMTENDYGYTNVKSVKVAPVGAWPSEAAFDETDITGTFAYIQPDDDNKDDQTVCQVRTPKPVPDSLTVRFRVEFETKQPLPLSRTGARRTYHFVAQWFPKIGVWWKGGWNCHQFHRRTEFFADYGVYDVTITVPGAYVIGATGGRPKETKQSPDGTTTYRFSQGDVHDFAWTTSPDFIKVEKEFTHDAPDSNDVPGRHIPLKPVHVTILLQPHHAHLEERYWTATRNALRFFGEWYGEYPYDDLTVVDPANDSRSGGMEYPTLFTGGANAWTPGRVSQPEGVTVHEFGHQFWYGLVGNNEFEEAWLDEGFNTYSTDKVLHAGWKQKFVQSQRYLGGDGAGTTVGIPVAFEDIQPDRQEGNVSDLRNAGQHDVMARKGWEYWDTYRINSYGKPGLSLLTLERYLGEEMMYRVMRTYHHRYRFKHPTSQDFINTVNEVTGKDMTWFFQNTWYSSNVFDYRIADATSEPVKEAKGIFNFNGKPQGGKGAEEQRGKKMYETRVRVAREGEAIFPVEVQMVFENGEVVNERWDGRYRWAEYRYTKPSKLRSATVDPNHILVMDINSNNNSRVLREKDYRSRAAYRWASKWMFWLQHLMETIAFVA